MIIRILSYFAAVCTALLIIAPNIDYTIPVLVNSFTWLYWFMVAALFGMYLLTRKLPVTLKILSVYLFLTCFVSQIPYVSFNAYILIVATFYFFLIYKKCDYKIIFNMIAAAFWLQVFIVTMQLLGFDTLQSFDTHRHNVFLGTVMQYMRFSSLLAILAPLLVLKSKWYIIPIIALAVVSKSSSFGLSVIGGLFVYLSLEYKRYFVFILIATIMAGVGYFLWDRGSFIIAFTVGRVPVWGDVIRTWLMDTSGEFVLPLQGPIEWKSIFFGRGIDSFLPLFPIYKHDAAPFPQVHNCWFQFLWEIGLVGFSLISAYSVNLIRKLYKMRQYLLIGGLTVIAINMFFAFPTRITQTILTIVCFLAYCQKQIEGGELCEK